MATLAIKGALVQLDDRDLAWAQARAWNISDTGYVRCYAGPGRTQLRMHRLIMERVVGRSLTPTEYIDHRNGDKLDNRRNNLRIATKSQNGHNVGKARGKYRSIYKGVGYANDGRSKAWMAYINLDGERWYIGKYYTQDEAAWMYDQWAIELHGEFARLNYEYV